MSISGMSAIGSNTGHAPSSHWSNKSAKSVLGHSTLDVVYLQVLSGSVLADGMRGADPCKCSIGDRLGDRAGHGSRGTLLFARYCVETRSVCALALSCWKVVLMKEWDDVICQYVFPVVKGINSSTTNMELCSMVMTDAAPHHPPNRSVCTTQSLW